MGAWDGGRQDEREREELEEVAGDESKLLKLLSDGSPLLGVWEGRRQDGREREEEVARDESRVVRAHVAAMTFDSSTGMYVCMYVCTATSPTSWVYSTRCTQYYAMGGVL